MKQAVVSSTPLPFRHKSDSLNQSCVSLPRMRSHLWFLVEPSSPDQGIGLRSPIYAGTHRPMRLDSGSSRSKRPAAQFSAARPSGSLRVDSALAGAGVGVAALVGRGCGRLYARKAGVVQSAKASVAIRLIPLKLMPIILFNPSLAF